MGTASKAPSTVLLQEHDELRKARAAVLAVLEGRGLDSRVWAESLCSSLRDLSLRLSAHFAHEEESGMFDTLRQGDDPACAERLLCEHGTLLHRLARLLEQGSRRSEAPLPAGWGEEVRGLVEDLGAHEARENEVLLGALESSGAAD